MVATGAQSDATMTKSDSEFVLTETLQFFYNPNHNLRDNVKKNSSQDIFKYSHFRLFTTLYLQTTVSRFRQNLFR